MMVNTKINKDNFIQIITENQNIIHKICNLYFKTVEEKEDMFQEITLQLWKAFPYFRYEAKVSTWMYRIALNIALTNIKRNKKIPISNNISDKEFQIKDNYDEGIEKEERNDLLYTSIAKLDEMERAIILLYLDEKSYSDIAEITGLTKTNVGVKITRIKAKLEKIIRLMQNL